MKVAHLNTVEPTPASRSRRLFGQEPTVVPAYDASLDMIDDLMKIARKARAEGWRIEFATSTGPSDQITFSAVRPAIGDL